MISKKAKGVQKKPEFQNLASKIWNWQHSDYPTIAQKVSTTTPKNYQTIAHKNIPKKGYPTIAQKF